MDTNTITRCDRATFLEPSPFEADGGELIGRHPAEVPTQTLAALGFTSPIRAVRAKCVDCSGGSLAEARKCVAINCPLWAFRMGRNLFRGKGAAAPAPENKPHDSREFQEARPHTEHQSRDGGAS